MPRLPGLQEVGKINHHANAKNYTTANNQTIANERRNQVDSQASYSRLLLFVGFSPSKYILQFSFTSYFICSNINKKL